jgi:ATP-dependent DNA helicase RecG
MVLGKWKTPQYKGGFLLNLKREIGFSEAQVSYFFQLLVFFVFLTNFVKNNLKMDYVDRNLAIITQCINANTYTELETDRLELKDLSADGSWTELHKTVCAFLNTNGGVVIIGIKDKGNETDKTKKHYKFTGLNYDHENKLKELPTLFANSSGQKRDLSTYFPVPEIRDFQDGKVAVVYVDELPDDEKYVYFKGTAYKRRFTGDHSLSKAEIEEYEELKNEVIKNQELAIVKGATLDLLNIDTLNQYILRFNRGKKKGETLKASLDNALSFLVRENFVRDNQPTLLGMLVCGDYVENYIQGKCEIDCYVISPNKVAQNKAVLNDNIIELIEGSFNFIWRNIQVGVGYAKGGTAEPEYPEELIRESINNALAHRNYNTDRFVIIEIKPQESLMIRNPGAFQRRQRIHIDTDFGKIRRIIPIQVARNPKLTHLLKSFDYWEGKGRGLTSLIDACLENVIDVPYYVLTDGEIKLFIPKGKVYDDDMASWLNSFAGYIEKKINRELNEDEKIMLSFYRKSETLNRVESYTILLTMDNNHKEVIAQLEDSGLIFKDPKSPEIYPIYRVDRILMKNDFSDDLKSFFGNEWVSLKAEYREVLEAVYRHTEFGLASETVSANKIGTFVYLNRHKNLTDLNDFESFKRQIRNVFNRLESKQFIVRRDKKTKEEGGKPDFMINSAFSEEQNLFRAIE